MIKNLDFMNYLSCRMMLSNLLTHSVELVKLRISAEDSVIEGERCQ